MQCRSLLCYDYIECLFTNEHPSFNFCKYSFNNCFVQVIIRLCGLGLNPQSIDRQTDLVCTGSQPSDRMPWGIKLEMQSYHIVA